MRDRSYMQEHIPDGVIIDLDGTTTKRGLITKTVDTFGGENAIYHMLMAGHKGYELVKAYKKSLFPEMDLRTGAVKRRLLNGLAGPQLQEMPPSDFFSSLKIKTGLLSNNSRHAWGERLMRHVNFGGGFDHQMFSEDMDGLKKPNPYGALKMLGQMYPDTQPQTVWIVGDMAGDMQMAVNTARQTVHTVIPVAIGSGSALTYLKREGLFEMGALAFDNMDHMAEDILSRFLCKTDAEIIHGQALVDDSRHTLMLDGYA